MRKWLSSFLLFSMTVSSYLCVAQNNLQLTDIGGNFATEFRNNDYVKVFFQGEKLKGRANYFETFVIIQRRSVFHKPDTLQYSSVSHLQKHYPKKTNLGIIQVTYGELIFIVGVALVYQSQGLGGDIIARLLAVGGGVMAITSLLWFRQNWKQEKYQLSNYQLVLVPSIDKIKT